MSKVGIVQLRTLSLSTFFPQQGESVTNKKKYLDTLRKQVVLLRWQWKPFKCFGNVFTLDSYSWMNTTLVTIVLRKDA